MLRFLSLFISMTSSICLAQAPLAPVAPTASIADLHRLLDDVHFAIDHQPVTSDDALAVQTGLQNTLDLLYRRPSGLICAKSGTGLYYPASRASGDIVGDTSYQAGHGQIADCRATLPKTPGAPSCFRRANGLFFPTNTVTGAIIGSSSYQAGYGALADCLAALQ